MDIKKSAFPFLLFMILGLVSIVVLDYQVDQALNVQPELRDIYPELPQVDKLENDKYLLTHHLSQQE